MNAIEEAQCRVARAQDERDKLHEEIMRKHGSLRELDTACKAEKAKDSCAMYNGKAHKLRQNYQKSVAELRLAKSDLERERNEAQQAEERPTPVMDERTPLQRLAAMAEPIVLDDACIEGDTIVATVPPELQDLQGRSGTGALEILPNGDAVVELELGPEELPAEVVKIDDCVGCVRHGHLDPEECRTCEPGGDEAGNPTHYEPAPGKQPYWEGGPLDTVNGMPWHVAVAKCPVGDVVVLKPGTYEFISDEGGRLSLIIDAPYQVYGPITPDETLLQITRQPQGPPRPVRARPDDEVKAEREEDLKRFLTRRIAEEEAASAARRQVQLDLELQPVELSDGIKETERVRRSRVYEHDKFKLTISEDDLANLWALSSSKARTMIARKLKLLPDGELFPGEWDDEVELLHHELYKLSVQLSKERAAAAMRGEA